VGNVGLEILLTLRNARSVLLLLIEMVGIGWLPTVELWEVLLSIYVIHLIAFYVWSPVYLSAIVPHDQNERARELSHEYRNSALTVAALTFAGITFVFSSPETGSAKVSALGVLIVSIGLLIVSYFMEIVTEDRRVWVLYQEITVDYGVLSLLIGLSLLSRVYVSEVSEVANLMVAVAILVWLYGTVGMFSAYSGLLGEFETRRAFFWSKVTQLHLWVRGVS
jgi:hypothetical protein